MSRETTPLGLNQWTLDEKPKMQEFNNDNRIVDEKLTELNNKLGNLDTLPEMQEALEALGDQVAGKVDREDAYGKAEVYTKAEVDAIIASGGNDITPIYVPTAPQTITANTILSADHNDKFLTTTATRTITIPATIAEDFECAVMKDSATASVTITIAGSGVTIKSRNGTGSVTLTGTYGVATIKRISATVYHVGGDINWAMFYTI